MKKKNWRSALVGRFKSIQSSIFAAISLLVLSAVFIVTIIFMQYTRNTIFENSAMYTQTIIRQMN